MYFVERSKIEKTIIYIDALLKTVEQTKVYKTEVEKLALERTAHMLVEAIMDVGNMMIDGFIMRDPGSYHDIIDILIDEKVLPESEEDPYKAVVDLRQILVQQYLDVDHDQIEKVLRESAAILKSFSTHIRHYLQTELGVANAFANEP